MREISLACKHKAFEDAQITVGSKIEKEWSIGTVIRMTATKVQIDKGVFTKQHVGSRLLEGAWQVKESKVKNNE